MSSPIIALQTAVMNRLAADTELLELVPINLLAPKVKDRRLYAHIPDDALSPYIHFDAPYVSKVYVKPEEVVDVSFTLHIWHNQKITGSYGIGRIASVMQAVKNALRFRLNIEGYEPLKVTITLERIFDDSNPDVKHAVLNYTYKLMKK